MILSVFTALLFAGFSEAKIITKTIEYKSGDTVLEGYLAYDSAKKNAPGVMIVHDWTGVGPYVKKRAEQIAALGYVAFAADIYGKGVRPQPPESGKVAGSYKGNRPLFRERLIAGWEELKKQKMVNSGNMAAVGYCFGGTGALELARAGQDAKAVVSFHGGLDSPTPSDAKNVKGSVLVLHGADDPYVPEKEVKAFEDEMRAAGVDWQLVKFSKAVHSFTHADAGNDSSKGAAYHEPSDKRSWIMMQSFLKEKLGK
jgi:dienelactone hydrolase